MRPFFKTLPVRISKDSKTLVQEYAQSKKLSPVYEVIGTSGPEHEKTFECKLTVGHYSVCAKSIGKKNAEKAAAEQFVNQFHIIQPVKRSSSTAKTNATYIFPRSGESLARLYSALNLPLNYLRPEVLNEALIHSSFLNNNPGKNIRSYDRLSIMGSYILYMLCSQYIVENYDTKTVSVVSERATLLNEDNLCKALPDEIANYVLTASKIPNEKARKRIKIDVLKSVLAGVWLRYSEKWDLQSFEIAKAYAYNCLQLSAKNKLMDYNTVLNTVVHKRNYAIHQESKLVESQKDNTTVFQTSISISNDSFRLISSGFGSTKKNSRASAAKQLLLPLLNQHNTDEEIVSLILPYIDPETACEFDTATAINGQFPQVDDQLPAAPIRSQNATKAANQKPKVVLERDITFDSPDEVLYIWKGNNPCKSGNHRIKRVEGYVQDLNGNDILIDVYYCNDCNAYFIDFNKFQYYRALHGFLIGNFKIQSSGTYEFEKLADASVLKICGYTVNQGDALSSLERKTILKGLIDREILTKQRVMSYLKFFINNSQNRKNMKYAVSKWVEDLKWLQSYTPQR